MTLILIFAAVIVFAIIVRRRLAPDLVLIADIVIGVMLLLILWQVLVLAGLI